MLLIVICISQKLIYISDITFSSTRCLNPYYNIQVLINVNIVITKSLCWENPEILFFNNYFTLKEIKLVTVKIRSHHFYVSQVVFFIKDVIMGNTMFFVLYSTKH